MPESIAITPINKQTDSNSFLSSIILRDSAFFKQLVDK
jgi:hypothetical protein